MFMVDQPLTVLSCMHAGATGVDPAIAATQLQQPAAVVAVDQGVAAAAAVPTVPQLPDPVTQTTGACSFHRA